MHTHEYINSTTYNDGHIHYMKGLVTESPDTPGHVHCLTGHTSINDGHVHNYSSCTCPAFYDIHGDHYHLYSGLTDVADNHVHAYMAATSKYYKEYTERCCLCVKKKDGE